MAQKPQPEPAEPPVAEKPAVELPYQPESQSFTEGLTEELVFTVLAGEIAVQRGDLPAAYSYYLQAAKDAGDSFGAEQAVRISVYLKDLQGAIAAVEQWIRLSPNHLPGRTLAVMLYAQDGKSELAYEQLQALVKISNAQGEDGFMRAVTAISQIENRHMGLELIRRLATEHETDQRAGYALVLAAVGAEEYDEAEFEARRLVDTYPDREKMQALLSNILHNKGDDKEALRILEVALEESPENRTLLTAYARLLMEVDELEQAYQQFKKIERLYEDEGDVHYTLGILALELERLDEGREHLKRAIAVGNHVDEATYYIAYSYEVEEDYEQALLWYGRVEGGEQRIEAQIKSATLMAKQGDVASARELLRTLRQTVPQRAIEMYLVEGEILRSHEMHERMMSLYNQALEDFPGNHELLYGRALNAAAIGQLDILETDLQAILVQDPLNADALNALGYTLADKTDRLQEALGYIQQALDLKPEAPAILDSMGWVQYRLGNHIEALRYLQHAMDLMPDAEIASHLGEVLWVTGKRDEALKVWREALKRNPHSKSLLETMRRFGQ
jgi:tetratricopeptide (TPR) repeat protein